MQALDALPRYCERGLPFAAWLFRIARNVLTDAHRRRPSVLVWESLPESLLGVDADLERSVLRQGALARLRVLFNRLDADKRELLRLRFAGGLNAREIGEVVGKREVAVKKQLTRTLHTLKEQYHAA